MRWRVPQAIKTIYTDIPDHYGRVVFWVAVFVGVPVVMVWLALKLWWFWLWFRWFGVAGVILISWALCGIGLSAYRMWLTSGNAKAQEIAAASSTKEDVQNRNRHRSLIANGRVVVRLAASQSLRSAAFKKRLETETIYFSLRPHLSPEFMKTMAPPKMGEAVAVMPEGPLPICWLAQRFLDELDRLEHEWEVS